MKTATIERPHQAGIGGVQKIFKFKNGFGASVIQFPYSYGGSDGLWELAVIKFSGDDVDDWEIDYTTPITNYVIGYLSEKKVDELLDRIDTLVTLAKPTLAETIELAKQLKKSISSLANRYEDRRGNLSQSHDFVVDIICCLEGHQLDIQKGVE